MRPRRRETLAFAAVLAGLIAGFLSDSLFGGLILSPGDVAYADPAFADLREPGYEPKNRLLMDPALQFHPWLEFYPGESAERASAVVESVCRLRGSVAGERAERGV